MSTAVEHIDIIVEDIQNMINKNEDFVAFILISLGIEYLGNFYDEKDFNDHGQSKNRFCNGIKNLFKNPWYKNNAQWLYKNVRGPLVHQFWTGDQILLTSVSKNQASKTDHLQKSLDSKTIFVLEIFFEDFLYATKKLKNLASSENSLNKGKLNKQYSEILVIRSPTGASNFGASGT